MIFLRNKKETLLGRLGALAVITYAAFSLGGCDSVQSRDITYMDLGAQEVKREGVFDGKHAVYEWKAGDCTINLSDEKGNVLEMYNNHCDPWVDKVTTWENGVKDEYSRDQLEEAGLADDYDKKFREANIDYETKNRLDDFVRRFEGK